MLPPYLPLSPDKVEAAGRLYACHLPQWRAADEALARLKAALPDFSIESNLIKISTVNSLYSTSLRALHRMAVHIEDVLPRLGPCAEASVLVDAISRLPLRQGEPIRTHRSFASKFCHFFIDDERFPILDTAACDALRLHLGAERLGNARTSYTAFLEALRALRGRYDLHMPDSDLDRYLWIAGMYWRFVRGDRQINRDLLVLFDQNPVPDELRLIAGPIAAASRSPPQ